jgi:hypothetical protein
VHRRLACQGDLQLGPKQSVTMYEAAGLPHAGEAHKTRSLRTPQNRDGDAEEVVSSRGPVFLLTLEGVGGKRGFLGASVTHEPHLRVVSLITSPSRGPAGRPLCQ